MEKALAFGSYVPGKSPVHELNTQVKIILTCVFSVMAFFVETWVGMLLLWLMVLVGYGVSGISLGRFVAGLKPILFIIAFTVIANAISPAGILAGCFYGLRIALLVAGCCLVTFTSSMMELTGALERMLSPLSKLRLPAKDVSMVIALALRFVPTVIQESLDIEKAQIARGAWLKNGGPWKRIKAWSSMLVPLFVALFRRADELACAMDSRCYGMTSKVVFGARMPVAIEFVALAIVCAYMIIVCVLF